MTNSELIVRFQVDKNVTTAYLIGGIACAGVGETREDALLNLVWMLRDVLNSRNRKLNEIRAVLGVEAPEGELVSPEEDPPKQPFGTAEAFALEEPFELERVKVCL